MLPRIERLALLKGLESKSWKRYTVLIWFGAEIVGGCIAFSIYGKNIWTLANLRYGKIDWTMVNFIALGFAVASYFTVQDILLKKEDIKVKPYDINKHVED